MSMVRIYLRVAVVIGVLVVAGCATPTTGASTPDSTAGTATAGTTATAGATATAGVTTAVGRFAVTGTVGSSPSCPGPQRAESPCPPKPVAGAAVELTASGAVIASTTTDPTGHFKLLAPAGTYEITARNVGYASKVTQTITVSGPLDVALVVDSGIR
jgi:hypothetical protein